MATLVKCPDCGRVKRHGHWVAMLQDLEVLVKELKPEVLQVLCEECEKKENPRVLFKTR